MEPIIITAVFYLLVALLSYMRPNVGRIFIGLFFWLMAVGVHGYFILAYPQGYVDIANAAHFEIYRDLGTLVVEFSPVGFGIALALFELAIGTLMLSKARLVTIGFTGAAVFLITITPLIATTVPNLILIATIIFLMTKDFEESLWESLHRQRPGARQSQTPA